MKNLIPNYNFLLLFAFTGIVFCGLSCKKITDLFSFTISTESNFTVGTSSPANLPFDIGTPSVPTNSSQQFENNNSHANLVKEIKLKSLNLDIVSPAGKTFSFLESVHIYISTNASNEIELAGLDNINSAAMSISLIPTTAALDEYVKATNFTLRTKVVTKQVLTQNVDIKTSCKFTVSANL